MYFLYILCLLNSGKTFNFKESSLMVPVDLSTPVSAIQFDPPGVMVLCLKM